MSEQCPSEPRVDRLDFLRGQVDELDAAILALVSQRTALTLAISQEKQALGLDTMVPGRHNEVISHYTDALPQDTLMTVADATDLAETVMRISRAAQDRTIAAKIKLDQNST